MRKFISIIVVLFLCSCASKKEILYFQDADKHSINEIKYVVPTIQPNDILNISISALVPETAIPYNIQTTAVNANLNIDLLKLQGYLVSKEGELTFPVLGVLKVSNKTTAILEKELKNLLESGSHLIEPNVSIRILNAKFTILGEVKFPGTYSFSEQTITLPQALGYAGDLTINGQRNDVLLIREENSMRTITHLDLTSAAWLNSSQYYIKPNDLIIVNPNTPKIKSAGFIGNAGTLLTIASLLLTSVVLITNN